jgi:acetyl-CoA synthetase
MKPGSAGRGVPGIHPIVFDEEGEELPAGTGKAGNICIQNPWPGCFMTIWGDRDRFVKTYFGMYNKDPNSTDWRDWPYLTGDAAVVAADGYVRILGRIDDVINVSGHRLGTKEIESAALTVPEVAEAAVVPVAHEIKGKEPELYVSLKPGIEPSAELQQKVADAIVFEIGKIAKCKNVWIVPDMPKTRSGKIMRRVLGAISNKGDVGNVMTLANPEIVEEIQNMVAK